MGVIRAGANRGGAGSPVSVGISADTIDTTGANVPLTVTLEAIQISTGTDPQAAF